MKAHQVGLVLLMAILSVKAQTYYSCNFDNNDCSVRFVEDNVQLLKISSILQDRDYYFTDSTSISKSNFVWLREEELNQLCFVIRRFAGSKR